MDKLLPLLAATLVLSFIGCCTASALLQLLAWWRHRAGDAPVNLAALWKPEGYFDAVGLRQMQLARRLLLVGGVMYLSYGVLMFAASQVELGS